MLLYAFKALEFSVSKLTPFFTLTTLKLFIPFQVVELIVKVKDNKWINEVDECIAGVLLLALLLVSC